MFLNCYYFFFFFYFCIAATIGIITTIISNSVSKGKRTPKTSYKLWSFEFQSFKGRKEWTTSKFVLLPALGLGSTHTHTRFDCNKICTKWCKPTYICFPYTWVLKLASGLCTPMCFWACSHVVNSPCSSFRKRKRIFFKIHEVEEKKILSFLLHAITVELRTRIVLQHCRRYSLL